MELDLEGKDASRAYAMLVSLDYTSPHRLGDDAERERHR